MTFLKMFLRNFCLLLFFICGSANGSCCTCTRCPARWTEHNGNCYRYFRFRKSWAQAEAFCDTVAARGYSYGSEYQTANLVTIKSSSEQQFVYSYWYSIRNSDDTGLWIGLNDLRRNRVFRWIDDTPLGYTNWGQDEPNNIGGSEHFGMLFHDGKWNDESTRSTHAYICEMPRA